MKKILLTIFALIFSILVYSQSPRGYLVIDNLTDVASYTYPSKTLVICTCDNTIYRTTEAWSSGTLFNTVNSVVVGGSEITSNPNEILMNVGGVNQGQPNFTYDPSLNSMKIGSGTNNSGGNNIYTFGQSVTVFELGAGNISNIRATGTNSVIVSNNANIDNVDIIGGSGNSITQGDGTGTFEFSGIFSGVSNNLTSANPGVGTINNFLIGTQSLNAITANNAGIAIGIDGAGLGNYQLSDNTVHLPKLRIGQGTNGAIPATAGGEQGLFYDPASGEVRQGLISSGISSNPGEVIMNVGGTNQGQSDLTYDANNNVLFGSGITNTATNTANNYVMDFVSTLSGTSVNRQNFLAPVANSVNATGGVVQRMGLFGDTNQATATAGTVSAGFITGINNRVTSSGGSVFSSAVIGGEDNEVTGTAGVTQAAGMFASKGSAFSNANFSAIIGGQNIAGGSAQNTVFMPQLVIGRGTGGALPTAVPGDHVLHYDVATGEVREANINIIEVNREITSVELLSLNTSPIELVPAPGSGKIIKIITPISVVYTPGASGYSSSTVHVRYLSTDNIAEFTDAATGVTGKFFTKNPSEIDTDFSTVENIAIEAFSPTSNPLGGDGTITINFNYKILTFSGGGG